jgi:hypothetical protein
MASGRERTRREMFTICRSLLPVGEEILRGRDLQTGSQSAMCHDRFTNLFQCLLNLQTNYCILSEHKTKKIKTQLINSKAWLQEISKRKYKNMASLTKSSYKFHWAILLEKLIVAQLIKKCSALHWIQWLPTMFTTAHHGCNPEPTELPPLSHVLRHVLKLSSQLCPSPWSISPLQVLTYLQSSSSSTPTKILYAFITCLMHATCPTYLILIPFHEQLKLWSSSLCSFPQPAINSSPLHPNILLSSMRNLQFLWLWSLLSSGMWHHVIW